MKVSPEQVKAARKLLGWSQADLARLAGVTEQQVRRFEERARVPWGARVAAMRRVFERAGIEFTGVFGVKMKAAEGPDSNARPPSTKSDPQAVD
jgi:transcriptional regulator with XRE-family HTH domain